MIKELILGNNKCGNISLAPMAGVADKAFRLICKKHGCDYFTTEMISAKAITFNNKKTFDMLSLSKEEEPLCIQIFGSEPDVMEKATYMILDEISKTNFTPLSIDINMGCPVPKVVKNGDGSALMKDIKLASEIIKSTKKASQNIPVTVKTRLGWDQNNINVLEFSKMVEDSGASLITIHARTRSQLYSPGVNWDYIRQVKEILSIPVIGNGDITSGENAEQIFKTTNCDGIAIGRASVGNPWIFEEIKSKLSGNLYIPPTKEEKINTAIEYLNLMVETKGEKNGIVEARKVLPQFTKGYFNSPKIRNEINSSSEYAKIVELLKTMLV